MKDPSRQVRKLLAVCTLGWILTGCSNTIPDHSAIGQLESGKGFLVPEVEIVATSRFKELTKEIDQAKRSVERLNSARGLLLAKYTEFHPLVKRNAMELKQALGDLSRFNKALAEENGKLRHRLISPPV